jgi:2-polyprenyl-3-methyl-5-hydroxy-6-metoxy-1,4-benzoquinol methylase
MICLLCGSKEFELVAEKLRYDIARRVLRCRGCNIVSLEDPTGHGLDYSQAEYRQHYGPVLGQESTPREMFELSLPRQAPRLDRVRHLLHPEAVVAEIGCSTGHFLHAIRPLVKRVVGIEPNPRHAAYAREEVGLEVVAGRLEDSGLAGGQFDVLVMFQVLEHIADPLSFLAYCRRLLRPGGTLYLEVPNLDDALLSVYALPGYRSFYFKVPHVYYFAAPTLLRLMQKAGFSGATSSAQAYTLFNHVHWLHTGKPQGTQAQGSELPAWTPPAGTQPVSDEIRQWLAKADQDYRALLGRLGVGELLCFEGKATR